MVRSLIGRAPQLGVESAPGSQGASALLGSSDLLALEGSHHVRTLEFYTRVSPELTWIRDISRIAR